MIGKILGVAGAAGAAALGIVGTGVLTKLSERLYGSTLDKAVDAVVDQWDKGAGKTLVTASQSVRIEPYCLIDTRALAVPEIKDVLMTAQRLFTSYYLTAIGTENTIGNVKVSKFLDKFAPERDLSAATQHFVRSGYSKESYQFGLPFAGANNGLDRYSDYCSEASNPNEKDAGDIKKAGASVGGSTAKIVTDVQHLQIGQIVDVTITNGDKKGTIPVVIRLRSIGVDTVALKAIISLGATDNSNDVRLLEYRVGNKTLIGDLVMNQDRIDAYRRAAMADSSGYFRKMHARANKGMWATMMSGNPSVGLISSIMVTTSDTVREVERESGARLDNFSDRQNIFEDSMLMLMFVIDPDHETLRIYTRDIEDYATFPLRDLKSSSNNGNDLTEIMRSYLEGKVPGRL